MNKQVIVGLNEEGKLLVNVEGELTVLEVIALLELAKVSVINGQPSAPIAEVEGEVANG